MKISGSVNHITRRANDHEHLQEVLSDLLKVALVGVDGVVLEKKTPISGDEAKIFLKSGVIEQPVLDALTSGLEEYFEGKFLIVSSGQANLRTKPGFRAEIKGAVARRIDKLGS